MYGLSEQTFICLSGQHYVFLALRSDQYFCVEREQLERLSRWLRAWPGHTVDSPLESLSQEAAKQVRQLVDYGLLTADSKQARDVRPLEIASPCATLLDTDTGRVPKMPWSLVVRFLFASYRARLMLARLPIGKTVETIQARSSRARPLDDPRDIHGSEWLTLAFHALRPLFPHERWCLFDSLALLNFLAHFDVYPQWIFGVRADPFGAHCWVQDGGTVLNDTLDGVALYTPIMAI